MSQRVLKRSVARHASQAMALVLVKMCNAANERFKAALRGFQAG
jgi:hypothetical protein